MGVLSLRHNISNNLTYYSTDRVESGAYSDWSTSRPFVTSAANNAIRQKKPNVQGFRGFSAQINRSSSPGQVSLQGIARNTNGDLYNVLVKHTNTVIYGAFIVPESPISEPGGSPSHVRPGNLRSILSAMAAATINSINDVGSALYNVASQLPSFSVSLLAVRRGRLDGLLGLARSSLSIADAINDLLPDFKTPPPQSQDSGRWVLYVVGDTLLPDSEISSNPIYNSTSVNSTSNTTVDNENFVSSQSYLNDVNTVAYNFQTSFGPTSFQGNQGDQVSWLDKFADMLDIVGKTVGLAESLGDSLRSIYETVNEATLAAAYDFISDMFRYMIDSLFDSIPPIDNNNESEPLEGTIIVKPSEDKTFLDLFVNSQDESIANVMSGMLFTPSYTDNPEYP